MIRVTVELLPFGDVKRPRHLGTCTITNDGTGTKTKGNYRVTLSPKGRPSAASTARRHGASISGESWR